MKHREEAEKRIDRISVILLISDRHQRRADEIPVSKNDALARAGRAGGVEEGGGVRLPDIRRRRIRRRPLLQVRQVGDARDRRALGSDNDGRKAELPGFSPELGDGDDERRPGVGGLLGELSGGVEGVDGGGDGAE